MSDPTTADAMVQAVVAGFDALQDEYQKLAGQHQALERKLATAREQYNELAKLCGSGKVSTPPLSLVSSASQKQRDAAGVVKASKLLEGSTSPDSAGAAGRIRVAERVVDGLRQGIPPDNSADGVKIWSGPSADRPERSGSMMPSISESPLEQDFTIEGIPSSLGCPFASMNKKKLSSHAASVLSRYNHQGSAGAGSTQMAPGGRIDGRDGFAKRDSRGASFADPIKAEICGMSDHNDNRPASEHAVEDSPGQADGEGDAADAAVCPIRFLDQHSPEEVATYFENHKHELPRSHELCVKRYQSNELQIRELDDKYGNIVSMIQGLGAKHKDYLPEEPEEESPEEHEDRRSAEKVRKWARSVSAQAADGTAGSDAAAGGEDGGGEEQRLQHFERPLRDIRLGESPSRPWGIQVPAQYFDTAASERSSKPAQISSPPLVEASHEASQITESCEDAKADADELQAAQLAKKPGRCPFGFDQMGAAPAAKAPDEDAPPSVPSKAMADAGRDDPPAATAASASALPAAPTVATAGVATAGVAARESAAKEEGQAAARTVFNGPVFIGYGAEDAARFLRETGLGGRG